MKNNIKRKIKSLFLIPILAGAAITTPIILTSCGAQTNTDSNDQNIDNQQQKSKLEIITSPNPLTSIELVENTYINIAEKYINFNNSVSNKNKPKALASELLKKDISEGIISKMTKVINKEFELKSLNVKGEGSISFPSNTPPADPPTQPTKKEYYFFVDVEFTIKNEQKTGYMIIAPQIIDREDLYFFSEMIKNAYKQYNDDPLVKEIYNEFIGENESILDEIKNAYWRKGSLISFVSTIFYENKPANLLEPIQGQENNKFSTITSLIPLSFDGKYRFVEYKDK